MKYKPPPLAAIFFGLFLLARGPWPFAPPPPLIATGITHTYLHTQTHAHMYSLTILPIHLYVKSLAWR